MDRYTAAAIGNNLSGALSSIGEMFDPRLRAQADQQRLTNEGLGLRNAGFAIDNQYAPKVFGSQIALNQARVGTEGSQQAYNNARTEHQNISTKGLADLYASAGPIPQVNIPYDGTPAPNRFNNPGGAYPKQSFVRYGMQGKGVIGGGHPIGYYPNVESGIAANMAHFKQMNPVGKTVGEMRHYWTKGQWGGSTPQPGMNENEVITQEKLNDPAWMGTWMRSTAQAEGYRGGIPDDKISSGFTYYQSGGVPQNRPDLSRSAILASVGGVNPDQLTNALNTARASDAIFATNATPDQIRIGQAGLGVANPGFNTVAGTTAETIKVNNPKLRSDEAIAAGNAQAKLLGDLFAPGTRRGDGSMLGVPKTAPNSFNDQQKVNEMAQAASFKVFGVPVDEDGAPIEDPYAPTRRAWSQSYSNAMATGMSPIEAEAAANIHHFGTDQPEINSEDTFRFGLGKDPSLPSITNTEPLQASTVFGAQDPAQLATVAAAVPGLFGLPVQTPGISNSGAAVTGVEGSAQPSNPAPAQPAAELAKPLRASDQFKAREGSAERKERESKEKEIASLESDIQNVVKSLQSGEVTLAQAYTPNPQKVKLSDDSYNRALNRLKEMESRLEKLKGGGVQTGQTATGQQTIRRYNPTTGAIE